MCVFGLVVGNVSMMDLYSYLIGVGKLQRIRYEACNPPMNPDLRLAPIGLLFSPGLMISPTIVKFISYFTIITAPKIEFEK